MEGLDRGDGWWEGEVIGWSKSGIEAVWWSTTTEISSLGEHWSSL